MHEMCCAALISDYIDNIRGYGMRGVSKQLETSMTIVPPESAAWVGDWYLDLDKRRPVRAFRGAMRSSAISDDGHPVCVEVMGDQYEDGTTYRCVFVNGGIALDTPQALRALIGDLQAVADEWETWSES
jgi:hypothetical protein